MKAIWLRGPHPNDDVDVKVLEVGMLRSKVSYRTVEGELENASVPNMILRPQPCGICRGKGEIVILRALERFGLGKGTCGSCEGRGHTPGKSRSVMDLYETAGKAFKAGLASRLNTKVFKEPESFVLCGECLSPDCAGDCE